MKSTLVAVISLLLLGSTADAQCIKKPAYARYAERVLLTTAGAHEPLELVIRNVDSCTCPQTCFSLSPGWRTPVVDPLRPPIRVKKTGIETATGGYHPPYVCLKPGQEATLYHYFDIGAEQDGPGHVIATMFISRYDTTDYTIRHFDAEGTVIAYDMDYHEARALVYNPAPSEGD